MKVLWYSFKVNVHESIYIYICYVFSAVKFLSKVTVRKVGSLQVSRSSADAELRAMAEGIYEQL